MIPDAPDIANALRYGYPHRPHVQYHVCPDCGADIGKWSFLVEGDRICENCFAEYIKEQTLLDATEIARLLGYEVRYEEET